MFGFSEPALLEEAEIAGGVENDVVEEGNAEDFAGLLDLASDINIRGRGVEAALGVVVGQDEAGGAVGQDFGKHFARVDRGTVQESHGDDADVQDLVGAIDGDGEEMLLLAVGVVADQRKDISRGGNLEAAGLDATAGKLDGGDDAHCLDGAHAFEVFEVLDGEAQALGINDLNQVLCGS